MYLFGIAILILTLLITFLRGGIWGQNESPLPKDFVPDFGDSDKELGKKRKKIQWHPPGSTNNDNGLNWPILDRWAKKLGEQRAKETEKSDGFFEIFDREMEYIQAKKELERRHPIRKPAKYEGAFDLYELKRQESERKAVLAKMRKEIFERKDDGNVETKKNPVNIDVAEKHVPKTEASDLRKRNVAENIDPLIAN